MRSLMPFLLAMPVLSLAEPFDPVHLESLFSGYQREAAYAYAEQYKNEMMGTPEFDYQYGVAAIDTGHVTEGVFALERVLLVKPNDHVARLELGRGYFLLDELTRARQEFEMVLAAQPPQTVVTNINLYLDQIRIKEARYKSLATAFVEVGYALDSNVNSGIDHNNVLAITLGIIDPNSTNDTNDSASQEDTTTTLAAGMRWSQPFAQGWSYNLMVMADMRQNKEYSQFDSQNLSLNGNLVWLASNQSLYRTGLSMQQYKLDGNAYRDLLEVEVEWQYLLSPQSRLSTVLAHTTLDYETVTVRNSAVNQITLMHEYRFATLWQPQTSVSLNAGSAAASEAMPAALMNTERDFSGYRLAVLLSIAPKHSVNISVNSQSSDYVAEQTLESNYSMVRADELTSIEMRYGWLFARHWRLDVSYLTVKNNSNIDIYDYDKNVVSTAVNYSF